LIEVACEYFRRRAIRVPQLVCLDDEARVLLGLQEQFERPPVGYDRFGLRFRNHRICVHFRLFQLETEPDSLLVSCHGRACPLVESLSKFSNRLGISINRLPVLLKCAYPLSMGRFQFLRG
jgi:hypothetical protein